MNKTLAILGLVSLVASAVGSTVTAIVVSQPNRYDFAVFAIPDSQLSATMNKAGIAGWRVVAARRAANRDSSDEFEYELLLQREEHPFWKSESRESLAIAMSLARVDDRILRFGGEFFSSAADFSQREVHLGIDGSTYHRAGCPVPHDSTPLLLAEAKKERWRPCARCKPDDQRSSVYDDPL